MNLLRKLHELELATPIAVVGMGTSGRSVLRYLHEAGYDACGYDERTKDGACHVCFDDPSVFMKTATLIVSPGVDRRRSAFAAVNAEVINDIELFARLAQRPIAAVTGSNGKSTVVSMLAESAAALGFSMRLCGNIGRPVLEALFDKPEKSDFYVLELSSYQLELCPSLRVDAAAVLNVSPDHLDRYDSYGDYIDAKANLARQSQLCIFNGDDPVCAEMAPLAPRAVFFGAERGNRVANGSLWIDDQPVLATDALAVHGKANFSNALVTLLLGRALGLAAQDLVVPLCAFRGLAHRMVEVNRRGDILWLDDSKATNIAAAAAALEGAERLTWLIAGGLGKGQDFSVFTRAIRAAPVKEVLVIGRDNRAMLSAFDAAQVPYRVCGDLDTAVAYAKTHAQAGDQVLLSPATASFDQFKGFAERGERFAEQVSKR